MTDFGLGILGAGGFATFLAGAVADLPGVRIVAVADRDEHRAATLAAQHGATALPGWAELVADERVDIVVVATPPSSHAEHTIAAVRAGKHVFCEKPLATTAADADAVLAAVQNSGRLLLVDHVLRYNPLLRALESLVAAGLLPPVQRLAMENDAADEDLPPEHWFWDAEVSGGIFVEHGVHFFDAARTLLGTDPMQVQALGARRPSGVLDSVAATVLHPGGALASYAHAFTHAHRAERQLMRIDFGTAEARLTGWIPLSAEVTVWTDDAGVAGLSGVADPFAVPGFPLTGKEIATIDVIRDAGRPTAMARGVEHVVPHEVRLRLELGGPGDKPRIYAGCVRAAMDDLLRCARHGGSPVADVHAGRSAVLVASAATDALHDGRTHPVGS